MTPNEIEQLVSLQVARQMQTILPILRSEIEKTLTPLRADIIEIAAQTRNVRTDLSVGAGSTSTGPTREELQALLPEKIKSTGLGEIVKEVAEAHGVDIDDKRQWVVFSGLERPSANQLARRSS